MDESREPMGRPTVMHASDLHLSHLIWRGRPEIWGDAEFALRQLVGVTRELSLETVVLAGDVTDTRLGRKQDIRTLHECLGQISEQCLIMFVAGNHDLESWVDIVDGRSMNTPRNWR